MKDLRVVFMGTPEFAVTTLKELIKANYNIVGVITAPDRPSGRGRKLKQSAVKEFALEQELKILQPIKLKDPSFLNTLKELNADLQIVVAFRMLPKEVWNMPRIGTFNLHASLLPEYRGAAPINWAIINGETKTGVSTFFINEKIDTGSILLQKEVEISNSISLGELHDQLMNIGSRLVINTIQLIENGNFKVHDQPNDNHKIAPKLNKENCRIIWTDSSINIYNKIRGLNPYPGAWTILKKEGDILELKIYRSEIMEKEHALSIGTVISTKTEMLVAIKNGFIRVLELKLAGKRKMDIKSLLNGYDFGQNSCML